MKTRILPPCDRLVSLKDSGDAQKIKRWPKATESVWGLEVIPSNAFPWFHQIASPDIAIRKSGQAEGLYRSVGINEDHPNENKWR